MTAAERAARFQTLVRKQAQEILEKLYKEMTYREIKVILIRVKSRKFLVRECSVCLDPINDDSKCRMLSCYHIFHTGCIDAWFQQD